MRYEIAMGGAPDPLAGLVVPDAFSVLVISAVMYLSVQLVCMLALVPAALSMLVPVPGPRLSTWASILTLRSPPARPQVHSCRRGTPSKRVLSTGGADALSYALGRNQHTLLVGESQEGQKVRHWHVIKVGLAYDGSE